MAVSLIISFFLFLPWLPFLLLQLSTYAGKELGYALNADMDFFTVFLSSFSTDKSYPDAWAYAYLFVFFASIALAWRKKEKKILFAALGVLVILGTLFGVTFLKKWLRREMQFSFYLFFCLYALMELPARLIF